MSTIKIPQNGLPQEIANIPFGQVIVLTDPNQGITSKTIKTVEFIHSVARKLNQKRHIVNSLPVDAADLWGCVISKVKTDDGVQILVSDWNSLLEMLCVFWGLDYEEVCKIPDIIPGWHKTHKGVTIGGESHPVRVHIKPSVSAGAEKDDYSVTLQVLPNHTKPNALSDIRKAFQDNFYHDLGVTIEEIIDLYDEVKKSMKTYHLVIDIEREEGTGKICNCKLILEDNLGNKYPLMKPLWKGEDKPLEEWEAQWKALYLTFILYPQGFPVIDLLSDEGFYQTFLTILGQLPRGFSKPKKDRLWENAKAKISKIRRSIMEATNDTHAKELFAIDGSDDYVYKVAGATDQNRETIKREFGLQ